MAFRDRMHNRRTMVDTAIRISLYLQSRYSHAISNTRFQAIAAHFCRYHNRTQESSCGISSLDVIDTSLYRKSSPCDQPQSLYI
jgi:hypothetical protein